MTTHLAPLWLYSATVEPSWIDYNNHMTEGFYGVAFCFASDEFIDYMGMDAAYRAATGGTIYTVENHINFLRELKLGAPLKFSTQLVGYDQKRMHVFHQMIHAEEGFVAATFETMMLHYNQRESKVTHFPDDIFTRFGEVMAAHADLPAHKNIGRNITPLKFGRK